MAEQIRICYLSSVCSQLLDPSPDYYFNAYDTLESHWFIPVMTIVFECLWFLWWFSSLFDSKLFSYCITGEVSYREQASCVLEGTHNQPLISHSDVVDRDHKWLLKQYYVLFDTMFQYNYGLRIAQSTWIVYSWYRPVICSNKGVTLELKVKHYMPAEK